MTDLHICSNIARQTLTIHSPAKLENPAIEDAEGTPVPCEILRQWTTPKGTHGAELDAAKLETWSPEKPTPYHLKAEGATLPFGHVDLAPNRENILVNGAPYYFRGYIRGITAHDHPNLTGGTKREYFRKNIAQAKKYGFNLVRFHSTIPDPLFLEEADSLGLFVHMEIGYDHSYDGNGKKSGIIMNREKWESTILQFRNHPSLAIFCLGNELHNSGSHPEVHEMIAAGKALAPNKIFLDNAGWGEFDRDCSDIFAQHIAYFFPYKRHADMFETDACWAKNGSTHSVPLEGKKAFPHGRLHVRRQLNPLRPVLAHEAIHYIDIPDYAALNKKYDDFAQGAGKEYLEKEGIQKPKYLTALPELIASKGLEKKMPHYIAASQHFKKMALKTYLERLRLSPKLCGFEMLQLSDCLKYENKNGILDFFDDDKYIDPKWLRQFNDDVVLLADFPAENFADGEKWNAAIHLSNFALYELGDGELTLTLNDNVLYQGQHFHPVKGVSKLLDMEFAAGCIDSRATEYTLQAKLKTADRPIQNEWKFWVYPSAKLKYLPKSRLSNPPLKDAIGALNPEAPINENVLLCDLLDDAAMDDLKAGKTVLLNYHRDRQSEQYYLPGALDRFKPCIWDRGHNLGGVVHVDWAQEALGSGRYFDKNFYYLVEGGYKVNLDHFPCPVEEMIWGIDKPVRDRMKGLVHGIKDFLPDDTLRNFSYLFALRVGKGLLVVCTFQLEKALGDPAAASFLSALVNEAPNIATDCSIPLEDFEQYLKETTKAGVIHEDVMNHFWEIDNKPVEDKLFWEEAQVDLRNMSDRARK